MGYQWDNATGHYLDPDTGQSMSRAAVRDLMERSITASQSAADHLAGLAFDGSLSPTAWRKAMREETKREYIRQYLLGNGGRDSMTKSDWGRVGQMLKEQYKYINGTAQELADGDLSEKELSRRSQMYSNSAREAFETANGRQAENFGYDEVLWELGVAHEHCEDCTSFADAGWQPLDGAFGGAVPGDGSTACLTHCHCTLTYRNSVTGDTW